MSATSFTQNLRSIRSWLFTAPNGARSAWVVIKWWETRRLVYNLLVGVVGVVSLVVFFRLAPHALNLGPGEDAVEPILLILTPILANLFYTGGWVVELALRSSGSKLASRFGPKAFGAGIGFSLFVAILPAAVVLVKYLAR